VAEPSGPPMATEPDHWTPAVLHVDMDAFFASVEVLDDPRLAGRPVIVGGSGARGVVASCTYEARAHGIRSAMPSVQARRLCPDAVFVDGRHSRYAEVSAQLHEILYSFTPVVEPIGLDEAFLDVTGVRRLLGPPGRIARDVRRRVTGELGLECSVGIGRSKMIAKLASRAAKPQVSSGKWFSGAGIVAVEPDGELAFLHPLPVEALWGVGPATAARLRDLGLKKIGDLAGVPASMLVRRLGPALGRRLSELSRGVDPDPVVAGRQAKSIGHEETFSTDVVDPEALERHAIRMAESVAIQLRASSLRARTLTVKVKFPDLSVVSRSRTFDVGIDTAPSVAAVAVALLGSVETGAGVRLLGIGASGLEEAGAPEQLQFGGIGAATPGDAGSPWERAGSLQQGWREVSVAVDSVRDRFGPDAVGTAAMVDEAGIDVPGRREARWGPAGDET